MNIHLTRLKDGFSLILIIVSIAIGIIGFVSMLIHYPLWVLPIVITFIAYIIGLDVNRR